MLLVVVAEPLFPSPSSVTIFKLKPSLALRIKKEDLASVSEIFSQGKKKFPF